MPPAPTLGKNTSYCHKDDLHQENLDDTDVAIDDDGVDEEDEGEDVDNEDDVGKSAGGVGVAAAANARDDDDDDDDDVDNGEEENEGGVAPAPPIPPPPPPRPPPPPPSSYSSSSFSSPLLPLLSSLRAGREELESAERADARSTARLEAARAAYHRCARALAGYVPFPGRKKRRGIVGGGGGGGGGGGCDADADAKRARATATAGEEEAGGGATDVVVAPAGGCAMDAGDPPDGGDGGDDGDDDYDDAHPTPPAPANELRLPERHASGGGMDESSVLAHRDEFSLRISGGEATSSTISSWTPPPNNANWKSRAQLDGWMDIVRHWDTGKGGMDAGAFRARHKTFYSRMKPASCNLGRRTGMHLREAIIAEGGGTGVADPAASAATATVLCRYNKAGNRSTLYLAVDQLFDALFELHSIELNHRGRDATKTLADERYANVPDATIRAFLDTCPICSARRGHHIPRNGSGTTTKRGKGGGGGVGGDDQPFDPTSLLGLQDSI